MNFVLGAPIIPLQSPAKRRVVQTKCRTKAEKRRLDEQITLRIGERQKISNLIWEMTEQCDFECLDGHYCITEAEKCNGVPDCIDHSDETEDCSHKRKVFKIVSIIFHA